MNGLGMVVDFPMVQQADGTWLATIKLTGKSVGSGYVMFDVEDQGHHIDRNNGAYWDTELCFTNRNIPNSTYMLPSGFHAKLTSYNGRVLAPGFQRAPDTARALMIVRDDFAKYPQNFGDLFWIWSYETEGGIGRGTDAEWAQVSRELDEQIAKSGTTNGFFQQILGFVAPAQARIDPAVIGRLRSAIIASPQTIPPSRWEGTTLKLVPKPAYWDDAMAKKVTFLLSQLDLPPAERIADPEARGAALEAFTKTYGGCGTNCHGLAPAFGYGVQAYGEAGDLDGAKRLAEEWMAWDPTNPDSPAVLAQAYLAANKRLPEALKLTDQSAELLAPVMDGATRKTAFAAIRSQMYFSVVPFPHDGGKLELLRGKIEAAMADWTAAAKDLQIAWDALAKNPGMVMQSIDAAIALGGADEHIGDRAAALKAYLSAASKPYQKDAEAHNAYVRLFVAAGKGTDQQAEDSLLAAVKESRAKEAGNYVPVELHQPIPKLQLTGLDGKPVRLEDRGRPVVVDLWATWCVACAVELPSLLAFQKAHPEVDVLALDVADKPQAVRQFLASKQLTGLHVALTEAFPEGMAQNYPTTLVISSKHEIAFVHASMPNDIGAELAADLGALNPQ
jgi:thiol-disulfide isomerase/thioredoxin